MPAIQLSGEFYAEVVRPVLGGCPHGDALLGWGSDVLGYDTGLVALEGAALGFR